MSKEQIEHELASRKNNIQYAQHEFQLDRRTGCMKEGGCLRIVEGLEMVVQESVLNSLGNEAP